LYYDDCNTSPETICDLFHHNIKSGVIAGYRPEPHHHPKHTDTYINFVDSLQARPSVTELSIRHVNQQTPATVPTTVSVNECIAAPTLAILKQKYREEVERSLKSDNVEHICTLEQFLKSSP